MYTINTAQAEELIMATYREFSDLLVRNRQNRSRLPPPMVANLDNSADFVRILGSKDLKSQLFGGLSADGYNYLLKKCGELANIYDLSTKARLRNGVHVDSGFENTWIDNRNGTFTAKEGANLWTLYGSDWKEKSGYEGDPKKLQPGTVVGRDNDIIEQFDEGIGTMLKENIGEEYYAMAKDFFVENVAYPAKRLEYDKITEFFDDLGLEIEEVDPESNDMKDVLSGIRWEDDESEQGTAGFTIQEGIDAMKEGTAAHLAITAMYGAKSKDTSVRGNFTPIRSILKEFRDFHKEIPEEKIPKSVDGDLKRPDIFSIKNCIIYEIKPSNRPEPQYRKRQIEKAKKQMQRDRRILNNALEEARLFITMPREPYNTVIPGQSGVPGAPSEGNAEVVQVGTKTYRYWSPEDGVILYNKLDNSRPRPNPELNPKPVPVAGALAIAAYLLKVLLESLARGAGGLLPIAPGLIPILLPPSEYNPTAI